MGSVECSLERGGGARSPGRLYVFLGGLTSARRHVASFAGALLVLFVALNGPLHNLSDTYLFSAHMGQHLLLTLVFPPLLLYGTPAHVVRPLLRPRWVMTLGRVLTRPLAAALVFTGPIVISHLLQMLYLFLLGIPMSITGALITLSGAVLYPFYSAAPRVGGLSPLDDQQIGGLLMWVLGGLMLWIVMTVIWFRYSVWDQRGDAEWQVPAEAYGSAEFEMRNAESQGEGRN